MVLDALERMHAHLTAAVVSNDPLFLQAILSVSLINISYKFFNPKLNFSMPHNLDYLVCYFLCLYWDVVNIE